MSALVKKRRTRERAFVCPPACARTCVACLQMRGSPTTEGGLRRRHFSMQHWSTWMVMMSSSLEACCAKPSFHRWQNKCREGEQSRKEACLQLLVFVCVCVFVHAQLWTYTYISCSRSTFCINAFTINGVHVDMCAFLCRELVGLCSCAFVCSPGSWRCRHPGGLAGRIQSRRRWYSGLRCWSGGRGYCTLALHCGLMVPGSQWLRTNNVRNYQGLCVCGQVVGVGEKKAGETEWRKKKRSLQPHSKSQPTVMLRKKTTMQTHT